MSERGRLVSDIAGQLTAQFGVSSSVATAHAVAFADQIMNERRAAFDGLREATADMEMGP